jgi:hypothetical protein
MREMTPKASTPIFPTSAVNITKSDTAEFSDSCIYVGTGGNVVVTTADGQQTTFNNVLGGTVLPVMCKQVRSSSTTASDFVRVF